MLFQAMTMRVSTSESGWIDLKEYKQFSGLSKVVPSLRIAQYTAVTRGAGWGFKLGWLDLCMFDGANIRNVTAVQER